MKTVSNQPIVDEVITCSILHAASKWGTQTWATTHQRLSVSTMNQLSWQLRVKLRGPDRSAEPGSGEQGSLEGAWKTLQKLQQWSTNYTTAMIYTLKENAVIFCNLRWREVRGGLSNNKEPAGSATETVQSCHTCVANKTLSLTDIAQRLCKHW